MNRLLIQLLKQSVEECYSKDFTLIERSMEQACVARIFYYMQEIINTSVRYARFKDYNLDCEYNKNGEEIKDTPRCKNGTRPDIILHKRGSNDKNLLVVEFKSHASRNRNYQNYGVSKDIIKLEDFTSDYVYNYQLGVWVKLLKTGVNYLYFQYGHKIAENEVGNE